MGDYSRWLDTRGMDPLTLKRPILDSYRHRLAVASATVTARLAALSSFYRYALSADLITHPIQWNWYGV